MLLDGFTGTDKSVLCSTVIEFMLRHREGNRNVGIAFFYFAFDLFFSKRVERVLPLDLSQNKKGPVFSAGNVRLKIHVKNLNKIISK